MKKWIYILAIGMLPMASCQDELNQEPFNALSTENAFKTQSDFENAIRGAYAGLRLGNYYGGQDAGSMIITPDILSDNLIINSQGRFSQQNFFNFTYTANGTWGGLWNNAYTTINRANFILEFIDKLPEGAEKENIKAEALALRGLAHFDLLRVFAKRYEGSTDADLGVPYVTSTDPKAKPARTPLRESYRLLVEDLVAAEKGVAASNGVGRLNKSSVNALLGRVYLYMGPSELEKSVAASTAAINAAPAANGLASIEQFPDIWTDAAEVEVLFKVKILDADNINVGVGYQQTSPQGVRAEYSPSYDLFSLYRDEDVRKNTYIGESTFSGLTSNYVKKHVGRAAGRANVIDVKVIRLSEVYLNRAEALYKLNRPVEALADLNEIRSRRYSDFSIEDAVEAGQALLDAILLERRLELAFEGHRFFDLKRLGLPIERSEFGDAVDGTGVPAITKSVPAGNNLFQLPIPQYEIDANSNIVQNDI
jgi:hypothetical protein